MAKSELLMLAHTYQPDRDGPSGWYVSEKLDGVRCWWDGGISRGLPKSAVPWANTAKDDRLINVEHCTGLWSRYGNVFHAPDWWLDALPPMMLDGELYAGRGRWQTVSSTVQKIEPIDQEWEAITYAVFGLPQPAEILKCRKVTGPNYNHTFTDDIRFATERIEEKATFYVPKDMQRFSTTWLILQERLAGSRIAIAVEQTELPFELQAAEARIRALLDSVQGLGGEGLIIRAPNNIWVPERVKDMLKVKPYRDAEGVVIGYVAGRSRLRGRMGALRLQHGSIRFDISGFSDAERCLSHPDLVASIPGQLVPANVENRMFPRGAIVAFRFREYSDDGIPKEARYFRPWSPH